MSGSVDGHVRTYDLRKGELRTDYIGRTYASTFVARGLVYAGHFCRPRHFCRPDSRRVDVSRNDARWAHPPHGCYYRKIAE